MGIYYIPSVEYTLAEAEKVWLIGDTHFDHANIIGYCNRPFRSALAMNNVIRRYWNDTIASDGLVYFLGDMTFGRGSKGPRWWAAQLNGRKIWVKGSHDRGIRPTSVIAGVERIVFGEVVVCNDIEFLLVHDVFDPIASGWYGWYIHGHNHDNQPYFNPKWHRVNVSVEAIGYKPISLAQVVKEVNNA